MHLKLSRPVLSLFAASFLASVCSTQAQTQPDGVADSSAPARPTASFRLDAAVPAPKPDTYSTELLEWQDASRQRKVAAKLYLPAGATKLTSASPLIIFSHGIGGSREGYSYLGKYWAANGIAALHLQHVGSDRSVWGGNPLQMVMRLQGAAQETEAIDRAKDASYALTQVLADPRLKALIDPQRIAAAGHSYGANTAMLLAGARVPRADQVLNLRDERIKAALLLSAPPFYREPQADQIVAAIAVPTMHVTATADDINIPGYGSGVKDREAIYTHIGSTSKTLAVFTGGSHSVFTDRMGTGGIEQNPKIKLATRELSLAFWQEIFAPTPIETAATQAAATPVSRWREAHAPMLTRFERKG